MSNVYQLYRKCDLTGIHIRADIRPATEWVVLDQHGAAMKVFSSKRDACVWRFKHQHLATSLERVN